MTWALDEERRRNNTTMAIAAAVAVVLGLVVFGTVTVLRRGDDRVIDRGSPSSPVATAPVPTGLTGSGGSGGGDVLTSTDVAWVQLIEGVELPKSAAGGPSRVEGPLAMGFAQTPAGAVLAAVNITARSGSSLGPSVYRPTIAAQMVGADKDRYLARVEQEYRVSSAGGVTETGAVVADLAKVKANPNAVLAYRMDSFDASAASLQVLYRSGPAGGTPVLVNFAWTVRWVNGDWRLVAPLNGQFENTAKAVPAIPAGYTVLTDR